MGLITAKTQLKKNEHESIVKELVKKISFQLSTVCNQLLELGIETIKNSLKRFLKSLGYSYKRARAKITKYDKEAFQEAKKESTIIVILDNAPTLEDYIHRVLASYGKNEKFKINFG